METAAETTTTRFEPGIYPDLPAAAYHAAPAIDASMLKDVLRSPLHCWARHIDPNREEAEPSAAMQLGTALHAAVLEPATWASGYAVAPECDRRTKAGKETWARFQEEAAGKTVISRDHAERAEAMAAAVLRHPSAAALLRQGAAEHSAFYRWPSGDLLKVRPDWWSSEALVDVKKTKDASPGGFARQVAQLHYHLQAAFYIDTIGALTGEYLPWYWIAVEPEPPYAVAVYQADPECLAVGRDLYWRAFNLLLECEQSGSWPGYPETVQTLRLPGWALQDQEDPVLDEVAF